MKLTFKFILLAVTLAYGATAVSAVPIPLVVTKSSLAVRSVYDDPNSIEIRDVEIFVRADHSSSSHVPAAPHDSESAHPEPSSPASSSHVPAAPHDSESAHPEPSSPASSSHVPAASHVDVKGKGRSQTLPEIQTQNLEVPPSSPHQSTPVKWKDYPLETNPLAPANLQGAPPGKEWHGLSSRGKKEFNHAEFNHAKTSLPIGQVFGTPKPRRSTNRSATLPIGAEPPRKP